MYCMMPPLYKPNTTHRNLHVMTINKAAPNHNGNASDHHPNISLISKDRIWRLHLILQRGRGIALPRRTPRK